VNHKFRLASTLFLSTLSINSAMALPIDWNGVFGVDTHLLNNVCRTKDDVPAKFDNNGNRIAATAGTQGVEGDCGANFQTYILKLNPSIIINDGVTLKGELSSGYIRGGFAGDEATNARNGRPNNSYFFTTPAQRSALNVNQMYMELYADTALVKIGRMSKHYGLGIIFDAGNDPWDRFFTMYDGIEAEMKIGNFSLIPYWAKISSFDDNEGRERPAGQADVREIGVTAKYDNKNRDLVASILYGKRFAETDNTFYQTEVGGTTVPRGKSDVTIIEPFISKRWNNLKVSAEASFQTGDYGNVYGPGNSKLSASAYVAEAKYELNPKWDFGVVAGQVSGDKGDTGKFEAAYLNPNYQISDLMFRYHYPSFNGGDRSIFNSSIANAQFAKLFGTYKTDKWNWKAAFIFAKAMETAKAGSQAFHHEENYQFAATADQQDDLGYEIDFGFDYRWNPNVVISGYYGYWFVGDYFAFTNSANELSLENVHGGGLRATLEF
jgi:hypothetical protein